MVQYINVFMNDQPKTIAMKNAVTPYLEDRGYIISRVFREDAKFNFVIGGDGTFLRAVRESGFSTIPFVGINTGHLGFFQEIDAVNYIEYLDLLLKEEYTVDSLQLLSAKIETSSWSYDLNVVNEFFVSTVDFHLLQMLLDFDGVRIIDQSADGLIVSTPAGSTAYNLSADGAILYQTLEGFQVTTVSPIQSKRYTSLPSSIVVPSHSVLQLHINPDDAERIRVMADGVERQFKGVKSIIFCSTDKYIKRVAFTKNWYWHNLKDKFL